MGNTGTCPSCKAPVTHARVEEVRLCLGDKPDGKGLTFVCTECGTVLSVSFDPVTMLEAAVQKARAPRA